MAAARRRAVAIETRKKIPRGGHAPLASPKTLVSRADSNGEISVNQSFFHLQERNIVDEFDFTVG